MSSENEETLVEHIYTHEDFTLLEGIEGIQGDISQGLSVLVNDTNSNTGEIQGLVVNDELLGSTLTAVTLPDGTEAFVAHNYNTSELDKEESAIKLENGTIYLREVSDFGEGKIVQLELDPTSFTQIDDEIDAENVQSTYPQIQYINGVSYLITDEIDDVNDVWEISNGILKKKESTNVVKKQGGPKCKSSYICPKEGCTKAYSTLNHLKVHERTHSGQRPFRCCHAKCKKSFSTGYSLKAHLRTHTGEKPYKCSMGSCEKSFKTSGDLLKHIRTHTGERPFLCPFEGCGRSFTTSNIRKVHVRTHTGERPYKCTQPKCGKAFASATNYKNHIRIHSGEKPYVCSIENCGSRFTEYSSLYKHHLVHTQSRPFQCKVCCRRYRQHSTLVMHVRTAHAVTNVKEKIDAFPGEIEDSFTTQPDLIRGKVGQLQLSEDSTDNETQILFVDPMQLAALQQISLEEGFDETAIDTSLEGLNIKIEDIGFGWD